MKNFILIFLFSFSAFSKDINVTIFIHGTRKLSKLFFEYTDKDKINKIVHINDIKKKSCITHEISKALNESDPLNFSQEYYYVFGWSGNLSHEDRLEAAQILYKELAALINNFKEKDYLPKITIIAHSHGGNVALNMANIECENKIEIDKLILLACPVQEQTKSNINNEIFKNIFNICSTLDLWQILDPQGLHKENKSKQVPFFSQRFFDSNPKLKQAKLKIRNRGLMHAEFLKAKFFKCLPRIIFKMQKLSWDCRHLLKI